MMEQNTARRATLRPAQGTAQLQYHHLPATIHRPPERQTRPTPETFGNDAMSVPVKGPPRQVQGIIADLEAPGHPMCRGPPVHRAVNEQPFHRRTYPRYLLHCPDRVARRRVSRRFQAQSSGHPHPARDRQSTGNAPDPAIRRRPAEAVDLPQRDRQARAGGRARPCRLHLISRVTNSASVGSGRQVRGREFGSGYHR